MGRWAIVVLVILTVSLSTLSESAAVEGVKVNLPPVVLAGVPFRVTAEGLSPQTRCALQLFISGKQIAERYAFADEQGRCQFARWVIGRWGIVTFRLISEKQTLTQSSIRVIPAWLSLLPPLVAIGLALLIRQVLLALFMGVWVGAALLCWNPFTGFFRAFDEHLIAALKDADHITVLCFTLLLGGMVGIISKSGGTQGLVQLLQRFVRSDRSAQFIAWLLGLLVFFDDYANALFVGTAMRPLCDRFRISREKLSYLVDTTSAPVASLAFVSTWIGFEVSLIGDAFQKVGIQSDPYLTFIVSIPYRFYPLMALALPLWLIALRRDFGAMYPAEVRARTTGRLMAENAVPLANYETQELAPDSHVPSHWAMAVVPIVIVIVAIVAGLGITGYLNFRGLGITEDIKGFALARAVLSEADSYKSLLWGSALGCLTAAILTLRWRYLSLSAVVDAGLAGMRTMFLAVVILALAWSIGKVCSDLQTAEYLVHFLGPHLDPRWLPFLTSVISAGISFATGSSWATMSLVMPLVIPLVHFKTVNMPSDLQNFFLIATVSSVLAGSIFGDHCSPISDTTILSSLFSGADHIDHVRTQLPYAIVAGIMAWTLGDLATAYGLPAWSALLLGIAGLGIAVWRWGRPVPEWDGYIS